MFKNRAFLVTMVDNKNRNPDVEGEIVSVDYDRIGREVLKGMLILVGGYVAADTIRQSVVHVVKTQVK